MSKLHIVDLVALILVIIGGLNWGLVGLFEFNLVHSTVGQLWLVLADIIYVVVGVAAVYTAIRSPALMHLGHHEEASHKPHPAT